MREPFPDERINNNILLEDVHYSKIKVTSHEKFLIVDCHSLRFPYLMRSANKICGTRTPCGNSL
jgi:hypothetical protein